MRHILYIFVIGLLTTGCVPQETFLGFAQELHPESLKHASACYEAMEGPLKGDLPNPEVFLVEPEACTGHDPTAVAGCANKDFIKLVEGRWTNDRVSTTQYEPGHRLVAHEYLHVLYDTFQPDMPIDFHHEVFEHEMNSHPECNLIPRRYLNGE